MNCLRSIYFLITALFFLILLAIFHVNMLLTTYRDEEYFKSAPQKPVSFQINRRVTFDRLINFFNQFKSQTPVTLDEESDKLSKFIETTFPTIYNCNAIKMTKLNSSLLFEVQGNSSKKPFLIGVDLDVEILDSWSLAHRHFQVDNINEAITGLGTMSSKSLVMSLMEALNSFLANGHTPTRSFYILFLKDGEFFDHCSSELAFEYFHKHNVHFDFVLESPGVVLNHTLPGVKLPVAIIGTTRKGYIAMELSVKQVRKSIRSFKPFPLTSAIASISANSENKFGQGIEISMIANLSQYASYPHRLMYTNLWFFKPLLSQFMSNNLYWQRVIRTKSILRTYHFIGMTAEAIVEQETHPNVNVYERKETNQKIANKYETNMRICDIYQPKRAFYDFRTDAFLAIKNSIQLTFANSIVIPGDCYMHSHLRHFENISDSIYQFSPTILSIDGIERYNSNFERLTLTEYLSIVRFYYNLFVVTNQI